MLGVLGIASPLTVAEAEEGPQPCRFVVTMDVPELWIGAGDRVVTYPGAEWRARAVRDVSPEAVVRLMSLGALAPFMPDVATDESSASGASVRPIQSLRPGPRARRLSSS